jgi:hypothetical protein
MLFRLCYTYDWGNQTDWQSLDVRRPLNVGLSEFVVPTMVGGQCSFGSKC